MYIERGKATETIINTITNSVGNEVIVLLGNQGYGKRSILDALGNELRRSGRICHIMSPEKVTNKYGVIRQCIAWELIEHFKSEKYTDTIRSSDTIKSILCTSYNYIEQNMYGEAADKLCSMEIEQLFDVRNQILKRHNTAYLVMLRIFGNEDIEYLKTSAFTQHNDSNIDYIFACRPDDYVYESLKQLICIGVKVVLFQLVPHVVNKNPKSENQMSNIVTIGETMSYSADVDIREYIANIEEQRQDLALEDRKIVYQSDELPVLMYLVATDAITRDKEEMVRELFRMIIGQCESLHEHPELWVLGNYCLFNNAWSHFVCYTINADRFLLKLSQYMYKSCRNAFIQGCNKQSGIEISKEQLSKTRTILRSYNTSLITTGFSFFYNNTLHLAALLQLPHNKHNKRNIQKHIVNAVALIKWQSLNWNIESLSTAYILFLLTQDLNILMDELLLIKDNITNLDQISADKCLQFVCYTRQQGSKWHDVTVLELAVFIWKSFESNVHALRVMKNYYRSFCCNVRKCRNSNCNYYTRESDGEICECFVNNTSYKYIKTLMYENKIRSSTYHNIKYLTGGVRNMNIKNKSGIVTIFQDNNIVNSSVSTGKDNVSILNSYNYNNSSSAVIGDINNLIARIIPTVDSIPNVPRDTKDSIKDDLCSIQEQVNSSEPKKSRLTKALSCVKKFAGEFSMKLAVTLAAGAVTKADWSQLISNVEQFISQIK